MLNVKNGVVNHNGQSFRVRDVMLLRIVRRDLPFADNQDHAMQIYVREVKTPLSWIGSKKEVEEVFEELRGLVEADELPFCEVSSPGVVAERCVVTVGETKSDLETYLENN